MCQAWFDRYPDGARLDLGERFRSKDDIQHISAYFELLLHEILLRLGFHVTPHPSVPSVRKRPDFLVESESSSFYLEATVSYTASTGKPEDRIIRSVYDWIDQIPNPHYRTSIDVDGTPRRQPKKHSIVAPIARLMEESDPEQDRQQLEARRAWMRPEVEIPLDGWSLLVRLTPKPRSEWGIVTDRTIGAFPGGSVRDIAPDVRSAITDKAKQKQASRLDRPLVIACSTIDGFFTFERDSLVSLFGLPAAGYSQPHWDLSIDAARHEDGVWIDQNAQPQNRSVAAVWLYRNARPVGWTPSGVGDCLFFNPFARHTLPAELSQLSKAQVSGGRMTWGEGIDLASLLQVPQIGADQLREPDAP